MCKKPTLCRALGKSTIEYPQDTEKNVASVGTIPGAKYIIFEEDNLAPFGPTRWRKQRNGRNRGGDPTQGPDFGDTDRKPGDHKKQVSNTKRWKEKDLEQKRKMQWNALLEEREPA